MPEEKKTYSTAGIFTKIKWMQKCAGVNFSNWTVTPKTWIILGVMAVFTIWNLSGVLEYSTELGIRCTPWIFPHYFSMPVMWTVYGFLTIALFSDAPFHNTCSDFLQIRTGKRIWILGQCLFILEASLCYTLAYFLLSVLMVLPRIIFINQWGKLIEILAYNSEISMNLTGISFADSIIKTYSPVTATLLTILFVWLVSCFLGMLILMCRVITGGYIGNAIAGFLAFLSYFCVYIGSMVFGGSIYKISPVSWLCIAIFSGKGGHPDMVYGLSFLILGILICGTAGSICYEKRDSV